MSSSCIPIPMTAACRRLLTVLSHSPAVEYRLVWRAQILLACAADPCNETVATGCGTTRETVRKWRRHWLAAQDTLAAAEEAPEGVPGLRPVLMALLADAPRAGRPATFTAEQVTQLFALACTPPPDVGTETSHWTPRELARELQRQGIVASISPRQVGRFLKGGRPQAASEPVLAHP